MFIIIFLVFFQGAQSLAGIPTLVEKGNQTYATIDACNSAVQLLEGYDARTDPSTYYVWRWGICVNAGIIPPAIPQLLPQPQ